MRYIFHISIPVADLNTAREFYENALGGNIGRCEEDWIDILLWGHQITLTQRPDEVIPIEAQGKRHFGVILPWQEWESLVERLKDSEIKFLEPPKIQYESTEKEQAKFYLQDPGFNVIEIKAYRYISKVVGAGDEDYNY